MEICEGCGLECVAFDVSAGVLVCEACGLVRQETVLRHIDFDDEGGRVGTYVGGRGTVGSLGLSRPAWSLAPGSGIGYRSDYKKRYATAKLDQLASLLRLPKDKYEDVKHMVGVITDEKWGAHLWMDVLIATCIYIVARQHHLPLSAAEIASTINCGVKDILRVYQRVLDHMEIESTPFDPAVHFDKVMSHHPEFMAMERDAVRRLSHQGHCLLQYGVEWSLAAGRHPLAIVAAVAVIVGKANNIKVDLDMLSRELNVNPATSRLRLREYKTSLVGFAQLLPWGKDITSRTLNRHLPFLLQYMETRMKMDGGQVAETPAVASIQKQTSSAEDVVLCHIARSLYAKYGPKIRSLLEKQEFDVVKEEDSDPLPVEETPPLMRKRKVDGDPCLTSSSSVCSSNEISLENLLVSRSEGTQLQSKKKAESRTEAAQQRTWKPLPPSFVANEAAMAKRTAKVEAAKKRIASVKQDMAKLLASDGRQGFADAQPLQQTSAGSLSSVHVIDDTKIQDSGLDAEDFLIQYCVIRGADEEVLKAGYYSLALSTPPVQPDREIMSDEELLQYFKTPSEIEFLQSLSEGDIQYPWLTREELELQALE